MWHADSLPAALLASVEPDLKLVQLSQGKDQKNQLFGRKTAFGHYA